MKKFSKTVVAIFSTSILYAGAASVKLISNPTMESVDSNGNIAEWSVGGAVTWEKESDGNHFLRITQQVPRQMPIIHRMLPVPQDREFGQVRVAFRARVSDLALGYEPWQDARVLMKAKVRMEDGSEVEQDIGEPIYFNEDTDGWRSVKATFRLPKGVTWVILMPCFLHAKDGKFDLDDMQVTLVEGAAPPEPKTKVYPPVKIPPEKTPFTDEDTLVTRGRDVYTKAGNKITLSGVNIASLEWLTGGEHLIESFSTAIGEWNVNIVRLPVHSAFWFGYNKNDKDFTAENILHPERLDPQDAKARKARADEYRALVDRVIDFANKRRCYILLDLHEFKAPTDKHALFWKDAGKRYANKPGVIFDLLNEPHSMDWEEWRNGGKLTGAVREGVYAENNEAAVVSESIGMQTLLNAVRSTGAKNIALIGGLDWAYDLWGIANGYELDDPSGNGLIYSTHIYPWKSDWKGKVLCIVDKYPILVGEVGCMDTPMPWEKKLIPPEPWANDMLAFIQKYDLNWTAWCFHPSASPCILKDWDYEPTPYWGVFVKEALHGKRFQSDRMR